MFQEFPYTDMHQLNLDWIIKIAKDFLDQYTHIQQLITDGETSLQDLTTEGLQQLQEKADNLESLLQQWYDTHSQDIADQLADALADLNEWYSTHENYLNQTLISKTAEFNNMADAKTALSENAIEEKGAETLASIPSDYTQVAEMAEEADTFIKEYNCFKLPVEYNKPTASSPVALTWVGDTAHLTGVRQDAAQDFVIYFQTANLNNLEIGKRYTVNVKSSIPDSLYLQVFFYEEGIGLNTAYNAKNGYTDIYVPKIATGLYMRIRLLKEVIANDDTISFEFLNCKPADIDRRELAVLRNFKDNTKSFVTSNFLRPSDFTTGGFINPATQQVVVNSGYAYSDYIEVFDDNIFIKKQAQNLSGICMCYDDNKYYLGQADKIEFGSNYCHCYLKPDTKYVRMNADVADPNVAMLTYNFYPSAYTPYGSTFIREPIANTFEVEPVIVNDDLLHSTNDNTDRTTDIYNKLIAYNYCKLDAGIFYVNNLTIPENAMLSGQGKSTILILGNSNVAVYVTKNTTIKDLIIDGQQNTLPTSQGTRIGILMNNIVGSATLNNITIQGFTKSGIEVVESGYIGLASLMASNIYIERCYNGIFTGLHGEYGEYTNITIHNCHYGILNNGGNNKFANCNMDGNTIGFAIQGSGFSNVGHGSCVGCSFNHNTEHGMLISNCSNGFAISGCNFFGDVPELETSVTAGLIVSGCLFGTGSEITIANGGLNIFYGCFFLGTHTLDQHNNNIPPYITACFDSNGNNVTF